jgi:hypothetical protein
MITATSITNPNEERALNSNEKQSRKHLIHEIVQTRDRHSSD